MPVPPSNQMLEQPEPDSRNGLWMIQRIAVVIGLIWGIAVVWTWVRP